MPTESRTEQLLNAYINGDDISNFVPLSRNEQILKDMILGNEQTSSPQSRIESLYAKLDGKIKEGSDNILQYFINKKKSCSCLFASYKFDEYRFGIFLDFTYEDLEEFLSSISINNVTNMYGMFSNCASLTTIPQLNTSNATNMNYMFYGCKSLTTIPQLNTSNVTNMNYMFYGCKSLTTIPQLNTSNVTDMGGMFYDCKSLTTIPQLNTSNVTNMSNMFYGCKSLTTIPQLNTNNVTSMHGTFSNCFLITTVPQLNTKNVLSFTYTFYQCKLLETIPELDMCSATDATFTFYECEKLRYLKLLNVKINLQIGSGTSWGHLIEKDCLIQIISELIKPSSGTKTLTMGTANIAKLADTYVKLLEDDGTGKYPFEVCKSTDEGAMTISDYCLYKNWKLA